MHPAFHVYVAISLESPNRWRKPKRKEKSHWSISDFLLQRQLFLQSSSSFRLLLRLQCSYSWCRKNKQAATHQFAYSGIGSSNNTKVEVEIIAAEEKRGENLERERELKRIKESILHNLSPTEHTHTKQLFYFLMLVYLRILLQPRCIFHFKKDPVSIHP